MRYDQAKKDEIAEKEKELIRMNEAFQVEAKTIINKK